MKYTQLLICGLLILIALLLSEIWVTLEEIRHKEVRVVYEIDKQVFDVKSYGNVVLPK